MPIYIYSAVRLGFKNVQAITFLLSDVVVPAAMDGRTLAGLAKRFRPELPIVLRSGYAE